MLSKHESTQIILNCLNEQLKLSPAFLVMLLFIFLQVLFVTSAWCYTKKTRERKLFIVTSGLRQERPGLASGSLFILWHILDYLSLFSDSHMHTLIYSKSVSPHRWNCFQGKGKKKKKESVTLFFLGHKIELSHAEASIVFPLTLHQNVVRCHPITGADKSRGEFNYISLKCERFLFQSKSPSMPVWTFIFNLFPGVGPLWQHQHSLSRSRRRSISECAQQTSVEVK